MNPPIQLIHTNKNVFEKKECRVKKKKYSQKTEQEEHLNIKDGKNRISIVRLNSENKGISGSWLLRRRVLLTQSKREGVNYSKTVGQTGNTKNLFEADNHEFTVKSSQPSL